MGVRPYEFGNAVTLWLMAEGAMVDPNQADREVYENGVEAGATQCWFFGFEGEGDDAKPHLFKAHADNGFGMDRQKHIDHMGAIMNTGTKVQGIGPENKGVGARIASLATNTAGVDSYSRSEAEALRGDPWHLVRLLPGGVYEWDEEDDLGVVTPKECVDATPEEVALFEKFVEGAPKTPKSGTVMVFRGDGVSDTWTTESWKRTHEYMQRRYHTFPVPVNVDGGDIPLVKKNQARSDYRYTIGSLRDYYAKHVGAEGTIDLSDGATIEWFLFDHMAQGNLFDDIKPSTGKPYGLQMQTGPARSNGFRGIAALDFNEAFNHSTYRPAFGLMGKAQQRVSLLITPGPGSVMQSTNRQQLQLPGGGELPWEAWGKEFSENMPDPIRALMESEWEASETITFKDLDALDPGWHKRITSRRLLVVSPDGNRHVKPGDPIVARQGGSGGVQGGKGSGNSSSGPNPGNNPGDQEGTRGGNNASANRQKGTPVRKRAATAKGQEEDLLYEDLRVEWLPDTSPDGGPTWTSMIPDSADTTSVRERGWAYYPSFGSKIILLRKSGDPFAKTAARFKDELPVAHHVKVDHDVQAAYAMEAITKVVHIRDDAALGWTEKDKDDQLKGLHLSFALTGLNSVEQTVQALLRKKGSPTRKSPKRHIKRKP